MSTQMELPLKPIAKHGCKIKRVPKYGLTYEQRIIQENVNFDNWLSAKGAWFK
jgi:hypothetical protein